MKLSVNKAKTTKWHVLQFIADAETLIRNKRRKSIQNIMS